MYSVPLEQDRDTDIGNMRKKIGEDRACSSGDMLADRQTDRQTDTVILRSPIVGGAITFASNQQD